MSSSGTEDDDETRIKATYSRIYKRTKDLAASCGLDAVGCWTNVNTFYKFPHMAYDYFFNSTFGSAAYALQKLISVYHHNSAYSIEEMDIHRNSFTKESNYDGSYFDLFTLPRLSSESLEMYSAGSDRTRVEKEEAIADFVPAHKFLSVCNLEYHGIMFGDKVNCSHCIKCLRTMSGFYALGKLDNFKAVFDVEDYKRNLGKRLGYWFAFEHGGWVKDFKVRAKANGAKIPFSTYLWHGFFKGYTMLAKVFRKIGFVRKLYYKLNIDILMRGPRSSMDERRKADWEAGKYKF